MKNSRSTKNYEKAIEIVAKIQSNPSQFDISSFLMKLIQHYPGEFVEVYDGMSNSLRHRVIVELRNNSNPNSGPKIRAIKLYRDETGVNLKDAKEAVEKIMKEEGIE